MFTRAKNTFLVIFIIIALSVSTPVSVLSAYGAVPSTRTHASYPSGVFTENGKYYYREPSSANIRKRAGFITWNNRLYYIQDGGEIFTGRTLKIGNKSYHACGNGVICRGLHKWGKYYYYANYRTGQLVTTSRFISGSKGIYYAKDGGVIITGRTFTVNGKQYRSWSNGRIATGVYKWGDKSYYSDPMTGQWIKKEGFIKWNNHTYYIHKNGSIVTDMPFVALNNLPYEAKSSGVCKRLTVVNIGNNRVVGIAQKQVGTMTGRKYWRWCFGTRFIDMDRTPWCACFAAWCYNEAGQYNRISRVKRYGNLGYVPSYSKYASSYGKWVNKKYAKGGDLIVFGRGSRHIGIVERIYNGYVFTIEGNSGPTAAYGCGKPGAVTRKVYKLSDPDIKGIIRP